MKTEFGSSGTRSWGFLVKLPTDVQTLVDLYRDKPADFVAAEDVLTKQMVDSVIRQYRLQVRLRMWKFVLQAVHRRVHFWYLARVAPRIMFWKKHVEKVAAQEAERQGKTLVEDFPTSEVTQKFAARATEAFDVGFIKKDVH